MKVYTPFFETLYDEIAPTGRFDNNEVHYSVLRAIVFTDRNGKNLTTGKFHDFVVFWDEDHDVRVFNAIQKIYVAGLLPSFLAFGERKAGLTSYYAEKVKSEYREQVEEKLDDICFNVAGDNWITEFTQYTPDLKPIRVNNPNAIFLANILNEWALGSKTITYPEDRICDDIEDK